jgi:hypothetical protein
MSQLREDMTTLLERWGPQDKRRSGATQSIKRLVQMSKHSKSLISVLMGMPKKEYEAVADALVSLEKRLYRMP